MATGPASTPGSCPLSTGAASPWSSSMVSQPTHSITLSKSLTHTTYVLGLSMPGRHPFLQIALDTLMGVEQKPDPMMMGMGGPPPGMM